MHIYFMYVIKNHPLSYMYTYVCFIWSVARIFVPEYIEYLNVWVYPDDYPDDYPDESLNLKHKSIYFEFSYMQSGPIKILWHIVIINCMVKIKKLRTGFGNLFLFDD